MKFSISTRSEEEIVFDVDKIYAAITRVLDLFDGIGGMIEEITDNLSRALMAFAHGLSHCILHGFRKFGKRARRILGSFRRSTECVASAVRSCVRILTLHYDERKSIFLRKCLLRSQDRGSSDDNSYDKEIGFTFLLPNT